MVFWTPIAVRLALIPVFILLIKVLAGGAVAVALFQDPLLKITVVMVVIIYLFRKFLK